MYCLVDFRNRPQYKYTFRTLSSAKECLKKIQNNSLGATVIYSDGRREYFEAGLPKGFFSLPAKTVRIKKGCHIKYKIRELSNLDGILKKENKSKAAKSAVNWKKKSVLSLFMLGNRKVYACLTAVAILTFSASFFFQSQFGQGAVADLEKLSETQSKIASAMDNNANEEQDGQSNSLQLADEEVIVNLLGKVEEKQHSKFQEEILRYIKGKPMEPMAPYIAKQPRIVAAFIVGIAMKESKFGVYAPRNSDGRDCLNYWGYRGPENTTASGYSCFNSPEQAIQVIGKKINKLVAGGISNPSEMISWKCGSSCAGHGAENVRKWISDVGINFYKINSKENS
jgi:hypothetical protein